MLALHKLYIIFALSFNGKLLFDFALELLANYFDIFAAITQLLPKLNAINIPLGRRRGWSRRRTFRAAEYCMNV